MSRQQAGPLGKDILHSCFNTCTAELLCSWVNCWVAWWDPGATEWNWGGSQQRRTRLWGYSASCSNSAFFTRDACDDIPSFLLSHRREPSHSVWKRQQRTSCVTNSPQAHMATISEPVPLSPWLSSARCQDTTQVLLSYWRHTSTSFRNTAKLDSESFPAFPPPIHMHRRDANGRVGNPYELYF